MRYFSFALFFISLFSIAGEINFPQLTGPVVDEANYLNAQERNILENTIQNIYSNGGPQIQILTIETLNDFPIEEYSIRLLEKWKIGDNSKGNGLLILIAKNERKLRIEVGNGIEGNITDAYAGRVVRNILSPAFKDGQYFEGLSRSIKAMTEADIENTVITPKSIRSNIPFPVPYLGLSLLLYIFLYKISGRNTLIRGILSSLFFATLAYIIFKVLFFIIFFSIFGFVIGLVGPLNFLLAFMHGSPVGTRYGGSSSYGGRGRWSGGGGGFSGGGASGDF